jgi:hypothetical protein
MHSTRSMNHGHSILCVGRSHNFRRPLLESEGFEVVEAAPEDAVAQLHQRAFKLVILAHDVPDTAFREIYSACVENAKIIQLGPLTPPEELFLLIERLMGPRKKAKVISIDRQ